MMRELSYHEMKKVFGAIRGCACYSSKKEHWSNYSFDAVIKVAGGSCKDFCCSSRNNITKWQVIVSNGKESPKVESEGKCADKSDNNTSEENDFTGNLMNDENYLSRSVL